MIITLTNDSGAVMKFTAPPLIPAALDVFEFLIPAYSLARVFYAPGDVLEIIERTDDKTHRQMCSLGNLRVKCKHFPQGSVWTGIELMITEGMIARKKS